MYVVKHIHGMDYLASRPGREFSTDSNIDYALKFETREKAEAAEEVTPGMWTVEPLPCAHQWSQPDDEGVKRCTECGQQRFA